MTASRHRREVARRTLVLGSLLALCLAGGIFALGVAEGNALRLTVMFVLAIAVGAGLLALDESRIVEARLQADLSRERAARTRAASDADEAVRALVGRIDQLEHEVLGLRRDLTRAPRSIVVVAQGIPAPSRGAARILEIADVVPAVWIGVADPTPDGPPAEAPDVIDLTHEAPMRVPSQGAEVSAELDEDAHDELIDLDADLDADLDDFPVVEVVGEFSLEGLSMFPRPAGMPAAFPSVDAGASDSGRDTADDSERVASATNETPESEVIDLRERQRSNRSA